MSKHTNFRIGGRAKYFFEAKNSKEVVDVLGWARDNKEKYFVLGGGSNTLVSDQGFSGLVIKLASRNFKIDYESGKAVAEAGVLSAMLARKLAEAGLTGFEWAVSLPGTIGGAVRGNAGCFGGETKDVIETVEIFDVKKAVSCQLSVVSCQFSYRDSIFKHLDPPPVILEAELKLKKDDPKNCLERINKNLASRKEKQPLESSSAGCIFKNYQILDSRFPDTSVGIPTLRRDQIPDSHFPKEFLENGLIPAGWLIEQAGLKGLCIGGAKISEKHGNFVLNNKSASAEDILEIIKKVKETVLNKFGINLQEEVQLVGFGSKSLT